jgi:hypothetical protein
MPSCGTKLRKFVAGLGPPPDCCGKIWANVKVVEKMSVKRQTNLDGTFMDEAIIADNRAKSNCKKMWAKRQKQTQTMPLTLSPSDGARENCRNASLASAATGFTD